MQAAARDLLAEVKRIAPNSRQQYEPKPSLKLPTKPASSHPAGGRTRRATAPGNAFAADCRAGRKPTSMWPNFTLAP
jgi:hypothetical protein